MTTPQSQTEDSVDMENMYVIERTPEMELEELVDKITTKVQKILSSNSENQNN